LRAEWFTGNALAEERGGAGLYVEMIRHPMDPERSPRGTHGADGPLRWKRDLKAHPSVWGARISNLLKDGKPRTLNGLSVELVDFGADITAGSPLGEALWALVEAGAVEHTGAAPLRFRWRGEPEKAPDYEAALRRVMEE
jgi:hypothetical protein